MVSTDLTEAEAHYLRAIDETTAPDGPADALAEAWSALLSAEPPTLGAVRVARPADLPDVEAFLSAWIARLRTLGPDGEPPAGRAPRARAGAGRRGGRALEPDLASARGRSGSAGDSVVLWLP